MAVLYNSNPYVHVAGSIVFVFYIFLLFFRVNKSVCREVFSAFFKFNIKIKIYLRYVDRSVSNIAKGFGLDDRII